jgi:hypothetical protein
MSMTTESRKLQDIIRRMAEGDTFFFSRYSPRITQEQVREIAALHEGFALQQERPLHEAAMCYPLDRAAFREAARHAGIIA